MPKKERELEDDSIPAWGWFFIAVCIAIPIITVGGAIPGGIGGGGAGLCAMYSRDHRKTNQQKVLSCLLISLVCWGIFAFIYL